MSRARLFAPLLGLLASLAAACGSPPGDSEDAASSETAGETGASLRPNWHEDVAPIVHRRCVGCHRDGGLAPFALEDHGAAADWAELIDAAVRAGDMPPWGARETEECQPAYGWVHDLRLSEDERASLLEWIAIGTPEGDPELAAALPEPPDRSLADPSLVLQNPAPTVLEGPADRFVCFSLDPGHSEDRWITGAELRPDKLELVHHALIMLDASGETAALADAEGRVPCEQVHLGTLIGSYFPGSGAVELPEQVGLPVPVGARVVLNYHYHPTGAGEEVDQSSLALRWTGEAPAYEALISSFGNATTAAGGLLPGPNDPDDAPTFLIPAGAAEHTETMAITVPEWLPEAELFMVGPHMHELGVALRVTHEREGQTRCLIHDPGWDPDWQMAYAIDAPLGELPRVGPGDRLELRCGYDNSLANPQLVEALARFGLDQPIDAHMGSAGLDEMCMLFYGLAIPR